MGSVGIGAGLDLALVNKQTQAFIDEAAVVDTRENVSIRADSSEDLVTLSTNLGLGDSVGIAGSASVYVIDTQTKAFAGEQCGP